MWRLAWTAIFLFVTGCGALHDRCHRRCGDSEPCHPEKPVAAPPPVSKAPEKPVAAPPPQPVAQATTPAIAQDVMLVPRMVYMPYVAQTPIAPMRLTAGPAPVGAPPPVVAPPPVGAPPPETPKVGAPPQEIPTEVTRQLLDVCKKLNERIDCLERKTNDQIICVPEPCPPARLFPLLRRPLFQRCEPLQVCDPLCPAPTSQPVQVEQQR